MSVIRDKLHVQCNLGDIAAAHPVPLKSQASTTPQHPMFIVRFRDSMKRDEVLRSRRVLKGTNISISEDLTNLNLQLLTRVRNDSRVQNSWSWNGRVFAIGKDTGKQFIIKPFSAIDKILANETAEDGANVVEQA